MAAWMEISSASMALRSGLTQVYNNHSRNDKCFELRRGFHIWCDFQIFAKSRWTFNVAKRSPTGSETYFSGVEPKTFSSA
jgi:hypothetical protein